jgi:hypothetical protein
MIHIATVGAIMAMRITKRMSSIMFKSIAEPLFVGKYFLDLRLVLALSHSEGELFSIAPIVEEVLSRAHPSRFNCDLDAHNLRSGS